MIAYLECLFGIVNLLGIIWEALREADDLGDAGERIQAAVDKCLVKVQY